MESKRTTSRIFAVMLSAAMIIPAAQAAFPVVYASSFDGWNTVSTNTQGSVQRTAKTVFELAAASYSGETLVPLACYGVQTVAGTNYYYICRQGSDLKKVVVYQRDESTCSISSVKDFNLNDYSHNNTIDPPDYPPCGGVELYSDQTSCILTGKANEVFHNYFDGMGGASIEPLAFLGTSSGDETVYAYMCLVTPSIPYPDQYIRIIMLSQNSEGLINQNSSYDLLCSKNPYSPSYVEDNGKITYNFSSSKAGYAQGKITLSADAAGTYKLYWANNKKALGGYYPIGELKLSAGKSGSVTLGYHTAIPAGATKVIATTDSLYTDEAYSVFTIPEDKLLSHAVSGNELYSFSVYSDLHIDTRSGSNLYWKRSKTNLRNALGVSTDRGADYIVISGDIATGNSLSQEWQAYESILSQSDFVNPVWESNGNHDFKQDESNYAGYGNEKYVKATGTDGSDSSTPYFCMVEKKTGDIFLFMALEEGTPNKKDVFSKTQINWAKSIIDQYYGSRNIFLVEHAPVRGFCAGDDLDNPYYGGLMDPDKTYNAQFKQMLIDYPDITFLSGHTHEDFTMDYNYFDNGENANNQKAANMIHTPALAGSTFPDPDDPGSLTYSNGDCDSCQGYHVQVFENEIVFNGLSVTEDKIFPQYSYIMEGSRTDASQIINTEKTITMTGEMVDATEMLTNVSSILSSKYTYSSYDEYQNLKKLYYEYKGQTTFDKAVLDEFNSRISDLGKHTGGLAVYPLRQTYYFTNNKKWSSVYAYAWTGSSKNAEWPGVKLSKVGTNSSNEDIYAVSFNKAGEFANVIFNSGSGGTQTVDISLCEYEKNAFYISGTESGKCTVGNWSYNSGDEPGPDPTPTDSVYLNYYIANEHDWANFDTKFTAGEDGKYRYTFTAKSSENLSFSIYNKTTGKYICVPESIKLTYEEGVSATYDLTTASSRGKSVTVYGLSAGKKVEIEYDQANSKVTVTFGEKPEPVIPLANESTISATNVNVGESVTITGAASGGNGNYSYAYWYCMDGDEEWTYLGTGASKEFIPYEAGNYQIKAIVSDVSSSAEKIFTVTAEKVSQPLENTSTVNAGKLSLGSRIYMTGSATGGDGNYSFNYYYKRKTAKRWVTLVEKAKAGTTVFFTPKDIADFDIRILATDGSGNTDEISKAVSIVDGASTAFENKSTISTTRAVPGTRIFMTGAATGSSGYRYAYYYKRTTAKAWKILGAEFGETTCVAFTPKSEGDFNIKIDIIDSENNLVSKKYDLCITNDTSANPVNKSTINATEVTAGTRITVTGAASGGSGDYTYSFLYKKESSSKWSEMATGVNFGTFKPKNTGVFDIKCTVTDSNGASSEKTFKVTVK